jgi:hypothetical protein
MRKIIQIIVVMISVATIVSGIVQVAAPRFVLTLVGSEITATTIHFFAIVGMFMILFGGLMLTTVYQAVPSRTSVFWCALQKLGASLAVILGICHGIFRLPAGGVALFDGLSGILFLYYLSTLSRHETA